MATPTWVNELGAKGVGESGTIGGIPSVYNAVDRRRVASRRTPPRDAVHAGEGLGRDRRPHGETVT